MCKGFGETFDLSGFGRESGEGNITGICKGNVGNSKAGIDYGGNSWRCRQVRESHTKINSGHDHYDSHSDANNLIDR